VACPSGERGYGAKRPQLEAGSTYVGEKRRYVRGRKGGHVMEGIKLQCSMWLSPLFKYLQKGIQGFS
jgi:hypothetical protein